MTFHKCKFCGENEVPEHASFCITCGRQMKDETGRQEDIEQAKPARLSEPFVVVIGVVIFGSIGISLFFWGTKNSEDTGIKELQEIEKQWVDRTEGLGKNPSTLQIEILKNIKSDLDKVKVSDCLQEAKSHLTKIMEREIAPSEHIVLPEDREEYERLLKLSVAHPNDKKIYDELLHLVLMARFSVSFDYYVKAKSKCTEVV